MTNFLPTAVADISEGISAWPMWTMLAMNDIRKRYRRSKLGQFWLTLTMAITIFGLGFVYAGLFRIQTAEYIPYVATAMIIWALISGVINESCNAFIENEGIIRYTFLPRSVFILRIIYRNLIVAAHNVLILPVVFVYYSYEISWNILWLVPGLLLLMANFYCIGFILAIICARYRDVPQIVTSIVNIGFFVTPVMFLPTMLERGPGRLALDWNPFANLLALVRDPVLGHLPSTWALGFCGVMLALDTIIMLFFVGRYGPRVVYWL